MFSLVLVPQTALCVHAAVYAHTTAACAHTAAAASVLAQAQTAEALAY